MVPLKRERDGDLACAEVHRRQEVAHLAGLVASVLVRRPHPKPGVDEMLAESPTLDLAIAVDGKPSRRRFGDNFNPSG
jgi:hypothetical protein